MAKKKTKLPTEATTTESTETKLEAAAEAEIQKTEIEDPIGDVTDGEAATTLQAEPKPESEVEAAVSPEASPEPPSNEIPEAADAPGDDSEAEFTPQPRPPAKLERLQKILAAAGVASRRSAESLIEQGRVQVNGKVVTVLGTKADAGRDHIRVDGKLLQGAERLRYFVLNKPKGYVTTVKDPEGRPTVMQFFEKMKERLYPVGRLDYMSEGLLVVTNDGELANQLTKASSGVEKTYLVKVAGQPTEAELEILRGGVAIERGAPGSPKVRTSPARIRQVRQGDNPWYEVVLIEGRNRELRKMFEEVGHFVEKIRRTGYGPLVLDQEPGNMRELEPEELELLRQAAEGKLRTPKSKEIRRRNLADAGLLPTVSPKPTSQLKQGSKPTRNARFQERSGRPAGRYDKPVRPERGGSEGYRPAAGRTSAPNPVRSFSHTEDEAPGRRDTGNSANFGSARASGRSFDRPAYDRPYTGSPRPASSATGRAATGRPFTAKPKFDKPAWKKPEQPGRPAQRTGRPAFDRPAPPRREAPKRDSRDFDDDLGPVRPPNLHIEEITGPDRSSPTRSSYSRPPFNRPGAPRSASGRPSRPSSPARPGFDRPASSNRPGSARFSPAKPFRSEGGLPRPFTTSSGKPRPGGARPSGKPGAHSDRPSSTGRRPGAPKPGGFKSYGTKPAGRTSAGPSRRDEGAGSFAPRPSAGSRPSGSSRPFTPRTDSKSGTGWKPKPDFKRSAKPGSGSRSKPSGFKSSGYKGKPAGPKRSGSRPGGKPGGKRRG